LFPAFSTNLANDRPRAIRLYHRGLRYMFVALFPVVLIGMALAPIGFRLWLGNDFAVHSASVFQWLAAAVFINCLANIPFAYLQALGRPDLTAKFHLAELPVYAVLLILMIHRYGILGAAIAWFVRIVIDSTLLFIAAHRRQAVLRAAEVNLCLAAVALLGIAAALSSHLSLAATYAGVATVLFLAAAWRWALRPDERAFLLSRVRNEAE
jgi:O-antigen/teichoic acid export membrane protein